MSEGAPRTVLVVHPDEAVCIEVGKGVRAAGYRPIFVPDGERAIDRFIQQRVGALIVNLTLPGRDGVATVESIRWAPHGDRLPVVLLGTRSSPERVSDVAARLGADGCLPGTVTADRVSRALRGVMDRRPGAATRVVTPEQAASLARGAAPGSPHEEPTRFGPPPSRPPSAPPPPPPPTSTRPPPLPETTPGTDVGPRPEADEPTGRHELPTVPREATPRRPSTRPPPPPPAPAPRAPAPAPPASRSTRPPSARPPGGAPPPRPTAPSSRPPPPPPLQIDDDEPTTDPGAAPHHAGAAAIAMTGRERAAPAGDRLGRTRVADPAALAEARDVERRTAEPTARLTGTLAQVPFPRLLARLAEQRASGALALTATTDRRTTTTGETPRKVVFFRSGVPRYVRSNLLSECLGQVLARSGRISQAALDESVARVLEGEGRQGGLLIAMGAITPEQLRESLEEQQRAKLFDVFAWEDGEFAFRDEPVPPAAVTLELSLNDIVYEGIRDRIPEAEIARHLAPHLDEFVVPVERRITPFLRADLPAAAARAARAIDGTRTLRALLAVAAPEPERAAALLYALHCTGAIAFRQEAEPVEPPRADARSPASEEIGRPPTQDLERLRRELTRLGTLLREQRIADALDVREEDADAVVEAADSLSLSLQPVTLPGAAPRELRTLAREVLARLAPLRRREPASSEDTRIEKLGTGEEEVVPDDTRAGGRAGRRSRALAPTPSAPEDDAATEPDEAPPPSARRPARAPRVPAPSEGERLDREIGVLLEAERQFRRGERALRKDRPEEALEAFARAVETCPDEGEFLAHLGYARYLAGAGLTDAFEQAMDELSRGCELSPKSDITHLLCARVLRDRGDDAGARDAYERALEANPRCKEALDGLKSLGR